MADEQFTHRARVTKDSRGKFRYTVQAANGRTVDRSEQGFASLTYALERLFDRWPTSIAHVQYTTRRGTRDYWVTAAAPSALLGHERSRGVVVEHK